METTNEKKEMSEFLQKVKDFAKQIPENITSKENQAVIVLARDEECEKTIVFCVGNGGNLSYLITTLESIAETKPLFEKAISRIMKRKVLGILAKEITSLNPENEKDNE